MRLAFADGSDGMNRFLLLGLLVLGMFIPLIVVNCMILGRQEAFAAKRPVGRALLDAAGTGTGFMIAMLMMGTFREVLGNGSIMGYSVLGPNFEPWIVMILPPGGFLTLGVILLFFNWFKYKKDEFLEDVAAAERSGR